MTTTTDHRSRLALLVALVAITLAALIVVVSATAAAAKTNDPDVTATWPIPPRWVLTEFGEFPACPDWRPTLAVWRPGENPWRWLASYSDGNRRAPSTGPYFECPFPIKGANPVQ